ncbi:MAG: hypothetical protein ITG07_13610 [Candidimonas sp.]|nr:hypothetical protein [Candidimonas sp.]
MTLTVTNVEAIKELVSTNPALCEELRNVSSRQEFTNKLATAALAKGIVVDEAALGKGLDVAFDQYSGNAVLSDEQLEGVTGGLVLTTGALLGLVAVVGIVCAAAGIAGAFGGKLIDKLL